MSADPSAPEGPLLVVSPHLHDAALSCAALLDRGEPVTVLDVCTLVPEPDRSTEWDRRCGFSSAKDAMAAREAEETEAYADSAHEVLAVDLLEGQYRDDLRGPMDERRLHEAVSGWIDRHGGGTVVLPAGAGLTVGLAPGVWSRLRAALGGHRVVHADPDHLWTRDVVLQLLRGRTDVAVWLYEELPHSRSRPADAAVALVADWSGRRAERVVLRVDRGRKAARLAAYTSQMPAMFRGGTKRLARRVPADERYWVLHPLDGDVRAADTAAARDADEVESVADEIHETETQKTGAVDDGDAAD